VSIGGCRPELLLSAALQLPVVLEYQ